MNPLSSDELDSEEMRRVMAESSLSFQLALGPHRVNDTASGLSEASCASNNNSWCSPSCSREVSCVVRAVDTIDGEPFIGLISKVDGEDGLRASIHQILHWSTIFVHKVE